MPVRDGANLLAQPRDAGCGVRHLGVGFALQLQRGLGRVQLVALILRTARDLEHRARHLARRGGQLFADRRQIAGRCGNLVRRPHDLGDDTPQSLPHQPHRIGQHLEFARHVARGDGS